MPLVAPFIAEQQLLLEKAREIYKLNVLTDTPTIMVEGISDIDVLTIAINCLSEKLKSKLDEGTLRIISADGTTQAVDKVFAWLYSGFKSKFYVLFDKDVMGKKAKNTIEGSELYKTKQNSCSIKIQTLQPSDEIIELINKNVNIEYEIEHLLSVAFWKTLKIQGLVEPRQDKDLQTMFSGLVPRDKTLDTVIDDIVDNIDVRDTILTLLPKDDKKDNYFEAFEIKKSKR